jgi:hypothetical protein
LKGTLRLLWGDARSLSAPAGEYFLTVCLGATHALGGLRGTLGALRNWTQPGGRIVVGEGFWSQPPTTEYLGLLNAAPNELLDDSGNVRTGEELGLRLVERWLSTEEEWDEFEDAYLEGIESYARESPNDTDVPAMIERIRVWRQGYLRWGKQTLGFGVYIFRIES